MSIKDPGIIQCDFVCEPMQIEIKAVDSLHFGCYNVAVPARVKP